MTFWAGKRYSSSNTSSHQFDWEYIQYNGTGGGFDKMDLGFAQFDAGIYAFSPTDETKAYPVDRGDQGYPDDYSLNLWFKKIGGTGLDLELIGHRMNRNENHPTAAQKVTAPRRFITSTVLRPDRRLFAYCPAIWQRAGSR